MMDRAYNATPGQHYITSIINISHLNTILNAIQLLLEIVSVMVESFSHSSFLLFFGYDCSRFNLFITPSSLEEMDNFDSLLREQSLLPKGVICFNKSKDRCCSCLLFLSKIIENVHIFKVLQRGWWHFFRTFTPGVLMFLLHAF